MHTTSGFITNSEIHNNTAACGYGGGVSTNRTMTIRNSSIHDNFALNGNGGGYSNRSNGALTVINSTFVNNQASGAGGAIFNKLEYTGGGTPGFMKLINSTNRLRLEYFSFPVL